MLVWHSASFGCSAQKKKKKKKYLFGICCYTWDHPRSFEFERFIIHLRFGWEHCTILLHGSRWHIGSEVWVSLALGPLDHCLHHLSHLIVTCFDLEFLGWVVHRCHTLLHFYPSLFLHFLLHPFIICLIPFHLLLSSSNVVSLYERRVWCTSPIVWHYSFGCRLSHLAHMILWHLELRTGFGI